jgi:hypothetical protein
MKKLKIQMNGRSDEFQTPKEALTGLLPFLSKNWIIWECAYGKGNLVKHLEQEGFKVVGSPSLDFIRGDVILEDFDCIITNPPYSKKEQFLKRCYEWEIPFALLLPLTALEGKGRGKLFKKYGIQLIIPNKRINFITPSGNGGGSWFQVAWFTYKLNLPKDLMFVELPPTLT